ncbi:hypothetical protein PINS_up009850 [Pythium insidiosum]|nr:hypothetical protein PINS_up009850 [Pythium insidiosum]
MGFASEKAAIRKNDTQDDMETSQQSRSHSRSRSRSPASSGRSRSRSQGDDEKKQSSSGDSRRRSSLSPASKPPSLRVENLTRNVNADHLEEIFGKFGKVTRVHLVRDSKLPRVLKGLAFVEFATREDACSAMDHMDDGWLDGRKVRVREGLLADYEKEEREQNAKKEPGTLHDSKYTTIDRGLTMSVHLRVSDHFRRTQGVLYWWSSSSPLSVTAFSTWPLASAFFSWWGTGIG